MTPLKDGERIVRCLTGRPVDHVPFGYGLGWCPWGETMERWKEESGDPELSLAQFGFEGGTWMPVLRPGIFPEFAYEVIEETEEFVTCRDGRGVVSRGRRDGGSMPEFLDYPVKSPRDWERLKEERLDPDTPGRLTEDWDVVRDHLEKTGNMVQLGTFPYGVFGTPRDFLGVEELLVSFYTEPDMIRDMMEHLTTLWLSLWEQVAPHVHISHIHIWEDMSGRHGSLISPDMVRSFMMPCYDRIADFAKRHRVEIVSVDTDGDCSELVPIMMDHGMTMMFPFEVQAGNDILEYRETYPELGIVGGLDKRALAGTKDDVRREIDKTAKMLERGRYIPSFDHLIPPDASWDNYRYAAEEIKKLCYESAN